MGAGVFVDPRFMPMLIANKTFPQKCTLQVSNVTRDTLTLEGVNNWVDNPDPTYVHMKCRKFDRLPHDDRTLEIIEELKYWTIGLAGYFPNIDPSWRVSMDDTGEIFAIDGVDADSLHIMSVITAHLYLPSGEVS